jgi:hypothetical protein
MRVLKIFSVGLLALLLMLESNNSWAGSYYDVSEVLVAPSGEGTTYYVDGANGNDLWNGKYDTFQVGTTNGPFKTIGKALDRYSTGRLVGGNTIKVKAGIYRTRISINNVINNIDENSRFVIGPYGDGEVIIDASDTHLLTWEKTDNPLIYAAPCDFTLGTTHVEPSAVIMDDNFKIGRPVYAIADVNAFGKWYYDSVAKKIYVHTNGDNPLAHDIIVTKKDPNNVDYGVYSTNEDYLTIYGLTIRGAGSYGIYSPNNRINVEKCKIKFSGKGAVNLSGLYNKLSKNLVYGNVLLNWPRGRTWDTSGGWPLTVQTKGYGYIGGNIIYENGGEGIGSYGGTGNVIVEDNIVHDNWSVNIYMDNNPNDIIRRNLVYNSGFYPQYAVDANKLPSWTTIEKVYKRMYPEGIITADETASGAVATSVNHQIYNNIIIGCYTGYSHYGQATGAGFRNFTIANNTIVLPNYASPYGTFAGIRIGTYAASTNTVIKNNIVYGTNHGPLVVLGSATDAGVRFDNNIYYDTVATKPFTTSVYPTELTHSFEAWKMATAQDSKSFFADPKFTKGSDAFSAKYYKPALMSPALKIGETLSMFNVDFDQVLKSAPWTVGALEGSDSGSTPAPPKSLKSIPAP